MSITDTISSVAASNPVVGVAVAQQSVSAAILASAAGGGDTGAASLLGAIGSQAQEVQTLLASLQPNLGQNINTAV